MFNNTKRYFLYILLAVFTAISIVSCGNPSGKGFLEKYKYTIMSQEQINEYVKSDGSYLKINGELFDFEFELLEVIALPYFPENQIGVELIVSKDGESTGKLVFKAMAKENKYYIEYEDYIDEENSEDYEAMGVDGSIELKLDTQEFLLKLPKTQIKNDDDEKPSISVEFSISHRAIGLGLASVILKNDNEILITNGDLGKATYVKLSDMLDKNPNITTIVLGNINGSVDDTITVEIGRMVRDRGLNTKLLKDSDIASGGVDLFASGVKRIYTRGAKVGVHSWSGDEGYGNEFPKEDKAHHSQLGYFTAMLPDTGYDFYFYTLNSASFDNIHQMSESELRKYKLFTEILE